MADKHDEQLLGFSNLDKIFPVIDVVDDLNSDSTNRPLSAKQGKTLKEMINGITSFNYEIVTELPAIGQKGIIYLILNSASTEENNIYDEYLYINNKYEKLGSFTTQIDLNDIKNELFYDLDISLFFENFKGTITVDKYNEILNAIKSGKLIRISGVLALAIADESSISIHINLLEIIGWVIINKTGAYYFLPDSFTLERSSYGSFPIDGFRYLFEDKSLIAQINFKIVDGDTVSANVIDYNKTSEDITFKLITGENFYYDCTLENGSNSIDFSNNCFYANNDTPGNILLGYQANANNYPLQADTEHRAFVNIPENKYELDINTFVQKPKGTITVDKYNEIANAIKDGKSIYAQGFLLNAIDTGSGVAIYMNIIYIKGWLMIDDTGAYYILPDDISLKENHDGYFEINYLYIFEDSDLLKLVNNIVIDDYGRIKKVIAIIDYKKNSNTISFKLCVNKNYYYECSFNIGDNNIDIVGGDCFYASNINAGVINLGYEQNGKNYPVQLNNLHQAFVNVPWSGSTYNNATQTSDGLMSKEDKVKLDGFTGSTTKILTQSAYDDLTNKDENTIYFIKG